MGRAGTSRRNPSGRVELHLTPLLQRRLWVETVRLHVRTQPAENADTDEQRRSKRDLENATWDALFKVLGIGATGYTALAVAAAILLLIW